MIKQLLKKVVVLVKSKRRRNRVSVLVYVGRQKIFWLSPAFFMQNMPEKDQKFLQTIERTRKRLQKELLLNTSQNFWYLGKYDIKGAVPYKNLYVMVLQVGTLEEVPTSWKHYLHLLDVKEVSGQTRTKKRVLTTIAYEVKMKIPI